MSNGNNTEGVFKFRVALFFVFSAKPFNIRIVWLKLIEPLNFEKYALEMYTIAPNSPEKLELRKILS